MSGLPMPDSSSRCGDFTAPAERITSPPQRVRRCDRIVVLRGGRIVEQGTMHELLRRDGLFAEYYRTQFAADERREVELGVGA
jgi:ABC-type multidrug transport system ATPase subunit